MFANSFNPWPLEGGIRPTSVYVISDSELRSWKEKRMLEEVQELENLINHHKNRIDSLEKTKLSVQDELKALEPTKSDK